MSVKDKQRNWDREEVVILVAEYFRTKHMQPEIIDENYHRISSILRNRESKMTRKSISNTFRNYSGIRLQSGRIRCLDPETEYNGMIGTKLQEKL